MKEKRNFRALLRAAALALVILTVTTVATVSVPTADAASKLTDATVKSYEEQIAALQRKQTEIQKNLTKLATEKASVMTRKNEIDSYLDTTMRKIEACELLRAELEGKIVDKEKDLAENKKYYDETYQRFLDIMVLSYEEGDASYLGLILGADSLGDFLVRMDRVNSVLEYNRKIMEELDTLRTTMEDEEAALREAVALQESTRQSLEAEQAEYEKMSEQAIAEMTALTKDQASFQTEYYKNKAEEDKLDKELEAYLAELQKKNQEKMESGEWLWPISLSNQHYVSSGFGWRLLYGVWDYHRGWDLAAGAGTPILASKSGTVVIATRHSSYGNYVVIDHGDGVSTVYAHARRLHVSVGDKVKRGDKIAEVGTTGNSTGNHLHFEFRLNGKYTDPFNYIKEPPIKVPASRYSKK